jgi:hypothetical protein
MHRRRSVLLSGLFIAGTAMLGGCFFTGNERLDAVRADPSPNIDTLYQRPEDIDNAMVVTFDENGRMFWQDLGRVWLTDRPSRLTREPMPQP